MPSSIGLRIVASHIVPTLGGSEANYRLRVSVWVPYDPNPKAIAGEFEIPAAIEISDLEVAVERITPNWTEPDVWFAWMHPAPEFDTTNFGPDRTFALGEPSESDLGDKVLSAVYVGD